MTDKDLNAILAENLQVCMNKHKTLHTRLALSKKAGVGQSTVGRILRQEVDPAVSMIGKLAKALDVTPSTLVIDKEDEASPLKAMTEESALQMIMEISGDWNDDDFLTLIFAHKT